MRLFKCYVDYKFEGAFFIPNGGYKPIGPPCPGCDWGRPIQVVRPFQLMYESGRTVSFASGGGTTSFFVLQDVARDLMRTFKNDFERHICYILNSPHAGPFEGRKVRGAHKYNGPPYDELVLGHDVPLNTERSSVIITKKCDICGRFLYKLEGIEKLPSEEKIGDRWEPVPAKQRQASMGILLEEDELAGHHFFTYGSNYTYCTEVGKEFIEARGWTGLSFLEVGEVIRPDL